jgi:hypothetical protein
MDKEQVLQVLEDLKYYIDVQPSGSVQVNGKRIDQLEGYKRASILIDVLKDSPQCLNCGNRPT